MNLIVSPHLDDAVLSLGSFMQTEPCLVVTVLAGTPIPMLTPYDHSRGFSSSAEAMSTRREEDIAALELVGATYEHLGFLDRQYGMSPSAQDLIDSLRHVYVAHGSVVGKLRVFVPLGIGHDDHRLVAMAAREAAPNDGVFVYEELPYRVLWPEQAAEALGDIDRTWDRAELVHPIGTGDRVVKESAIARYQSQLDDPAHPCFHVPERVWQVARKVDPCND